MDQQSNKRTVPIHLAPRTRGIPKAAQSPDQMQATTTTNTVEANVLPAHIGQEKEQEKLGVFVEGKQPVDSSNVTQQQQQQQQVADEIAAAVGETRKRRFLGKSSSFRLFVSAAASASASDSASDSGIATQCAPSASLWSLPSSASSAGSAAATSQLSSRSGSGSGSNWMMATLGGPKLGADGASSATVHAADHLRRHPLARGGADSKCKSEGIAIGANTSAQSDASEINIAQTTDWLTPISTNDNDNNNSNSGNNNNTTTTTNNGSNNNNNNDDEIDRVGLRCANEDERATDCCNERQQSSDSNQFNTYHQRPCLLQRHKHSSACAKRRRQATEMITPATTTAAAAAVVVANAVALAINNTSQSSARSRLQQPTSSNKTIELEQVDLRCCCLDHNFDTKTLLAGRSNVPQTGRDNTNHNQLTEEDNNSSSNEPLKLQASAATCGTAPIEAEEESNRQSSSSDSANLLEQTAEQQDIRQLQEPAKLQVQIDRVTETISKQQPSHRFNATEGIEPAAVSSRTLWQLSSLQHSLSNHRQTSEQEAAWPEVVISVAGGQQRKHEQRQVPVQSPGRPAEPLADGAMEILRQPTNPEDRLTIPKTYPNNTILVDLSKCHRNMTHLLPHPGQVSATKTLSCLGGCWPPILRPASSSSKGSAGCHIRKVCKRVQYNYHMPESLLKTNVTLKQEDYDKALSVLRSDVRYQLHLLLYRRVQTIWMLLSTICCILVPVLLANLETLMIVGACCLWLGCQIVGAFATTQFRKKLDQMLEKSVAQVNSYFMEHNLMLGVINVGGLLSKAKLIIPMLYFDTSQCREQIESIISIDSRNDADGNSNSHILDYTRIDLPLTKPNVVALAQSQLAKKIILRYSQRWISYFDKRKLMFNDDRIQPRHLSTGKCLCQFIEEQFRNNANLKQREQEKHNQQQQQTRLKASSDNRNAVITNNADQQQQKPREAPMKPQVIRKTTQMAPTIPTLSKLVSLREGRDHVRIDLEFAQQDQAASLQASNSWYVDMGDQQQDNKNHQMEHQQQHQRPGKTRSANGETPVSSPDLSLEMGGDLISRSDELVRKLRLLLELRKNELQGIDGASLFAGVLYKTPQSFNVLAPSNDSCPIGIADEDSPAPEAKPTLDDTNQQQNKTNEGKRFYTQREGLFFLGSNGAKKIQQDTSGTKHVLEIC